MSGDSPESEPEAEIERTDLLDRDYQTFSVDKNIYKVPIDDEEKDRMEEEHAIMSQALVPTGTDTYYFAPIVDERKVPKRILECGYGTGHWAFAMANLFPDAIVYGVDVNGESLPEEPPNFYRGYADLNRNLTGRSDDGSELQPGMYDYIHSRFVAFGLKQNRWPGYVRELRTLVNKGGYVEFLEYDLTFQSDCGWGGYEPEQFALGQWSKHIQDWQRRFHLSDPQAGTKLGGLMRSAGYQNVKTGMMNVHIGAWGTDDHQRYWGERNRANVKKLLESFALWPFVSDFRWPEASARDLIARAQRDLDNDSLKLYVRVHCAYGHR